MYGCMYDGSGKEMGWRRQKGTTKAVPKMSEKIELFHLGLEVPMAGLGRGLPKPNPFIVRLG